MGPVVKLYIYKAALALNDNKSVSITCVVAQVSGGLPSSRGGRLVLGGGNWPAALPGVGGLHCSHPPPGFREVAATGGGGTNQEQPQV